jgi:predicted secreted protein
MPEYCHRCGEELPAGSRESPFCPHCGAPQLFLALENQSMETGGEPAPGTIPGAPPPPHPQQVEWKTAIRCAALVAGIAALLSVAAMRIDVLSPISFLWIMSASLITLGLYRKRRPSAWVDVGVGARIGVVVGVFLALGLGMAMAGWGLVARFALHSMGSFDAQMAVQMQTAIQKSATPFPPNLLGFIRSPEFRAGVMLAGFAMLSVFLLALSTLGGAFAGLLRTRRA